MRFGIGTTAIVRALNRPKHSGPLMTISAEARMLIAGEFGHVTTSGTATHLCSPNVSVRVDRGEIVAAIGRSGPGVDGTCEFARPACRPTTPASGAVSGAHGAGFPGAEGGFQCATSRTNVVTGDPQRLPRSEVQTPRRSGDGRRVGADDRPRVADDAVSGGQEQRVSAPRAGGRTRFDAARRAVTARWKP